MTVNNASSEENSDEPSPVLSLDEPQGASRQRVTGHIWVKGSGQRLLPSDQLEATIPDEVTVQNRVGEVLDRSTSDREGLTRFQFTLDVSGLPNGRYPLALRLRRGGRIIRTLETAILVDHELGYKSAYERWIAEMERPSDALSGLKTVPVLNASPIDIVLLVERETLSGLDASLASVVAQSWRNWKLHLVSTSPEVSAQLRARYKDEARISIITLNVRWTDANISSITSYLPDNGHTCFLRQDDRLIPQALAHIVKELEEHTETELLYSDHDFIHGNNKRSDPVFKPDWSPDLLLSSNYIADILAVRNRVWKTVEGLRLPVGNVATYRFILDLTAGCSEVRHVARVLYHKPTVGDGQPCDEESPDCPAMRKTLQDHCTAHGKQVEVVNGLVEGTWRVRHPHFEPLPVSIVIASGGRVDVLQENIASLVRSTRYPAYEIAVIDNSREDRVRRFIRSLQKQKEQPKIRYLPWRNKAFNYSEINNAAARECNSPLLLFLNDDTSVIDPDWLRNMAELAVRPEVGAVGAKLLYPNGKIQHAGIVVGICGTAAHPFRGMDDNHQHYCHYPDVIRNVSAVTGACLMTRTSVFWEVGGFDADKLPIDFNDVDLCLKIRSRGYRVLYTPYATLYHHESLSRRRAYLRPDLRYIAEFRSRWSQVVAHDPCYNSNLTKTADDYSFRSLMPTKSTAANLNDVNMIVPWTDLLRLIEAQKRLLRPGPPLFSIVTPAYNTKMSWFIDAALSVLSQTNTSWEWCIVDDCSTDRAFHKLFADLKELPNIKILQLEKQHGISGATNKGLQASEGRFVCFLDHDDTLDPNALSRLAEAFERGADAAYTDSDKIDEAGNRSEPFYKPDWSPEFFRGVMYVGHLLCVRRDLAISVGGFDRQFDRIQDYEFFLRFSEQTRNIAHVPEILYHWRTATGSVALESSAKGDITDLQQRAVQSHLVRLGLSATGMPGAYAHRIKIAPNTRKTFPRISIIIPTKDSPDMIERCLASIFGKTTYPNFEVICVDNGTTDRRALEEMRSAPIKRILFPGQFNFSKANNSALPYCSGQFLVFMNNDIEVISPDWIEQMIYYAEQKEVGAVGALLLYPDLTVQHSGVVLGCRGTADHVLRGVPADCDGYYGSISCAREVSAVTAACLMMRRGVFEDIGMFNEHFFTAYQDVDLCLNIRKRGMRIIQTPHAKLIHHESRSRGRYYDFVDRNLLLDLWEPTIRGGDPYYNPNLNVETCDYALL